MRFKWMVIYPTSYMTLIKVVNTSLWGSSGWLSILPPTWPSSRFLNQLFEVQVDGYLSYLILDLLDLFYLYFHIVIYLHFNLPLNSRYSYTLFLRVEGLGVQSPLANVLADSQVKDLQNREYTRLPFLCLPLLGCTC